MATSNAIINAAKDNDLRERFVALAAEAGVSSPQYFVESHLQQLASSKVDAEGNTVASVYEYAETVYKQEQAKLIAPGKNPAAVTDGHLRYALKTITDDTRESSV